MQSNSRARWGRFLILTTEAARALSRHGPKLSVECPGAIYHVLNRGDRCEVLDFWKTKTLYASASGFKDMVENFIFKLSPSVTIANAKVE